MFTRLIFVLDARHRFLIFDAFWWKKNRFKYPKRDRFDFPKEKSMAAWLSRLEIKSIYSNWKKLLFSVQEIRTAKVGPNLWNNFNNIYGLSWIKNFSDVRTKIDSIFSLTGSQTITSRSQVHRSDQAVLINADSQSDPTIPSIQKQLPEGYRDAFG